MLSKQLDYVGKELIHPPTPLTPVIIKSIEIKKDMIELDPIFTNKEGSTDELSVAENSEVSPIILHPVELKKNP